MQGLSQYFGQQLQQDPSKKLPDTSEQTRISSLALLKMLKHGRAGVPLEVMGLMLGEFVDEYTINVVDVFAMPQSGTAVSVEAVDPVYQADMIEMLSQVKRKEIVVGWYHSHPGLGCFLSGVDINTAQSFEKLAERTVAVVVDPVQSVKGKVVMDAFRTIPQQFLMMSKQPRQNTSNLGHLKKPSIQALINNLNRHYYAINITYRKDELEQKMLLSLNRKSWKEGLKVLDMDKHDKENEETVEKLLSLTKSYKKRLEDEAKMTELEITVRSAGKINPKKHLELNIEKLIGNNVVQNITKMLSTIVF